MVNGKEKQFVIKKFYTRSGLAKALAVHSSTIEKLMWKEIIVPDAWIVRTSSLEDPIFDVARLEEMKAAKESYFEQVEAARALQFAK